MENQKKKTIAILGGGFGGVYTAIYLEKLLKFLPDWKIVLFNRENYFVYQPMLSEIVGGSLGIEDTVSPITRLAPKTTLICREIEEVDLEKKQIYVSPKFTHTRNAISYDHLVLALGNVTDFREATGLHEHALPFKNLADSLKIRNHLIDVMQTANVTENEDLKKNLLSFVVGGGGFSGTEITAELNDFVKKIAKDCPRIDVKDIRVTLVHSQDRLMNKELSEKLSRYAEKLLKKRGVEIRFNEKLVAATPQAAILESKEKIDSYTVVSTVPASANPIIEAMDIAKEHGRVKTDQTMLVEGQDAIWALGDCAYVPTSEGEPCPPTAQFAIRQAKVLALNIFHQIQGKERKKFVFKSLGVLGALGHRSAFAELFGCIKLSGFFAWILWRALYWVKLPGVSRRVKVLFAWILDAIFPIEPVQLKITPSQAIAKLHFESGEVIFHEGDIGDYLYIITGGSVEVLKKSDQGEKKIAELKKGEFFGEIALLNQKLRTATIRCKEPTDVLALRKGDFGDLIASFKELRETFEKVEKERMEGS